MTISNNSIFKWHSRQEYPIEIFLFNLTHTMFSCVVVIKHFIWFFSKGEYEGLYSHDRPEGTFLSKRGFIYFNRYYTNSSTQVHKHSTPMYSSEALEGWLPEPRRGWEVVGYPLTWKGREEKHILQWCICLDSGGNGVFLTWKRDTTNGWGTKCSMKYI